MELHECEPKRCLETSKVRKWRPEVSKSGPKGAKSVPIGAKREPKGAKRDTKWSQEWPKGGQRESKVSQRATKMHPKIDIQKTVGVATFFVPFRRLFSDIDFGMHFGRPLAHFGLPLASLWPLLAPFWVPFGSLLAPMGTLLAPFGSLLLTSGLHFLTFDVSRRHVGSLSCNFIKNLMFLVLVLRISSKTSIFGHPCGLFYPMLETVNFCLKFIIFCTQKRKALADYRMRIPFQTHPTSPRPGVGILPQATEIAILLGTCRKNRKIAGSEIDSFFHRFWTPF